MELLIIALLAAGGYYLYSQNQSQPIGPQGSYTDNNGVIWSLSADYGASTTGSPPIIWSATEVKASGASCVYAYATGPYATGLCPSPQGTSHDDVINQIKTIVATYNAQKNATKS